MLFKLLNITGITLLLFFALASIALYKCVLQTWNFFGKQKVKCARGIPFIGAHWRSVFHLCTLNDDWIRIYKQYPNERFIGLFGLFGRPTYLIRDPELIKQISIKDFEYFTNHLMDVHEDSDVLMCRTLFNMRDQRWKDMRATLSPTFTGSKMKLMFRLITDETKRLLDYLNNEMRDGRAKEYELRNLFGRVSSDTIASVSFGIENNALMDETNIFFRTGTSIAAHGLVLFIYKTIPKLANLLKISIFQKNDLLFFQKLATDNISFREKSGVHRNDMVDLLVDAKRGTIKYASDSKDENIGFATVDESYMKTMDKGNITSAWTFDFL